MPSLKPLKRSLAHGVAALTLTLLPLDAAPPPGGGGTGGGTIYFRGAADVLHTMNPDGSRKTPLPLAPWVNGEPSRDLHGGRRWFLQVREIAGEVYPGGRTRLEIFAFRDDGAGAFSLQLTNQPDLEMSGEQGRWAVDAASGVRDGLVSWVARRWDVAAGQVVEGGIYAARTVFDTNGNLTGLVAQPAAPLVPLDLALTGSGDSYEAFPAPNIHGHDWSPDGLRIVHDRFSSRELWVADALAGETAFLVQLEFARVPVWSPAGTKIAINSSQGIGTINTNGTGLKHIVKSGPTYSVTGPEWSPAGTHIAYSWWNGKIGSSMVHDVYRASADGGSKTNLTKDTGLGAFLAAWR